MQVAPQPAPLLLAGAPSTRRATSLWPAALLMPVGPAAVGLLRYLLPYYTESSNTGMAAAVAEQAGRQSAVLWLGLLATLTLVPGVYALAQLTRRAAPRLTAVGLALVVPGYLSLGGLLASDHVLWSGHAAGLQPEATAALLDNAHPTIGISLGVFVLGHVIGTVLLGIALSLSGRVPRWAGVALAVSQPLHFLAAVVVGSNALDLFAWSLTSLAMGVAAQAILRAPRAAAADAGPGTA